MHNMAGAKSTVRLARGGVGFLFVAALLLIAAVYTQNNLLFWSFGLMIGGLVVATVLCQFTLRGVSVARQLPPHMVAGEVSTLRYEVVNKQRILPNFGVVVHEAWADKSQMGLDSELPDQLGAQPAGWALHIGPGQVHHVSAPVLPQRRGRLQFRRVVVQSSFPFGIYSRSIRFEQPAEVLVYPPLYRLERQLLSKLSTPDHQGRTSMEKPGGVEDFYGLREYRPGDSLRTVDWKRSASRMTMVSREHELPQAPKVRIVLDLTSQPESKVKAPEPTADGRNLQLPESPVERAISLAASLVCEAYLRGCEVGLTALGVECPTFRPHHSVPHRTQILDALCRLDVSARVTDTTPAVPPRGQGVSIIVTAARGEGSHRDGARTLSAFEMDQYVIARENDIQSLLPAVARGKEKGAPRQGRKAAG
jgi:uncharacterized protein (DUF58 family)